MGDWFTVERADRDTFVISEYNHWEEPHCYLLLGRDRAALIDTGLGVSNLREVVDALTHLPVIVLTTHAHWDHIGGHGLFDSIGVHPLERDWLASAFPLPLPVVRHNLTCRPCAFPDGFDPNAYTVFQGQPDHLFTDGEVVDLGGRQLTVLHTPGHSPGHCCFYEARRDYLFSGDLIYAGCLDAFYPTTDPVQFAASVCRVAGLEVRRIFPGHHSLDLPVGILGDIRAAFDGLEQRGQLHHGSGIFPFETFQIHL